MECNDFVPDIVIDSTQYQATRWSKISKGNWEYAESAYQFYASLIDYKGFYLHASAIAIEGKAYLFSGPSGIGKSTHTRLWKQEFGDNAVVFNDDKPAIRCLDGHWFAYGTPWCGKDGINHNMRVPLAGICFLEQADRNRIRRLSSKEALSKLLMQTVRRVDKDKMECLLKLLDVLLREIPIFELENRPEPEAALLSYETMSQAAVHLK